MPGQFVPRGLMDRVQLADTPRGRGCQNMSDTDTTYATARPSAIGDLRFAGTIATGLVAGTLGLGALAAPLVGWKDWPSGLDKRASATQIRLAPPRTPQPRTAVGKRTGTDTGTLGTQVQGGGATPLTALGLPGGAGGATSAPSGIAILATGSAAATTPAGELAPRAQSTPAKSAPAEGTETTGSDAGTATFPGEAKFANQDIVTDSDRDTVPDSVESTLGSSPSDPTDAGKPTPSTAGLTTANICKIKSTTANGGDSNGDGVVDGNDDSDGDGVTNAVEEGNGTDPAL